MKMKWLKSERKRERIQCNLCKKSFRRRLRFQRFCDSCKQDEIFKFSEWFRVEIVK